jgi:perosamine synthetase
METFLGRDEGHDKRTMIPYGRQYIDEEDVQGVVAALRSDWLTTGPRVAEFEKAFARSTETQYGVAVSSGTAALHASMYALEIGPGDEVIVPALTFAATANCVVFQGGTPIFCDVEPDTLLIDPEQIEKKITSSTKAVVAVDYAGHPCDYDTIRAIADKHGLNLVADACHALGGEYRGLAVGSLGDLSTFSFHPVKHITTGEGGMITTNQRVLAERMRLFRNHGINTEFREREQLGSWHYEMVDLGYNYRITDIQCALGIGQLRKLPNFIKRRREIAFLYDQALSSVSEVEPLTVRGNVLHAYHLYVVKVDFSKTRGGRTSFFQLMRERGVRANVHYIPVHLHPYYGKKFGTGLGLCPVAEEEYEKIVSLPIYPAMTDKDVDKVVTASEETLAEMRIQK